MNTRRVLVTGGHGFLGRHLVQALLARGDEVTVLDSAPAPSEVLCSVPTVMADVRDTDRVRDAVRGNDLVLHMAAVVGVDNYLSRPSDVLEVNVDGTRAVLEAAAEGGARVVLASTSEIYGCNPAVPWHEGTQRVLGPTTTARWAYSTSKAFCEHLVLARVAQDGLDARIVRYFNVYGPGQRPAFVISRSVHRALQERPITVYDGGTQTRCFTYVEDAVAGTLRVADAPGADGEVFNIGSSTEWSVADAVRTVVKVVGATGDRPTPRVVEIDTRESFGPSYEDLDRRVPHVGKAREKLGWCASTDLGTGVRRTVEWARENPAWLALPDTGATHESKR